METYLSKTAKTYISDNVVGKCGIDSSVFYNGFPWTH